MRRLALITFFASTTIAFAGDAPGPDNLTLACAGPFVKNATAASITKAFGKANVKTETVPGAEGMDTKATVIYGADSTKRIEIFWWDEDKLARPATIRMGGEDSAWTLSGLAMGSTLAEVRAANGKPFKISGFDWDYGGYVTDWQGGALGAPGCNISVRFSLPADANTPTSMSGDGVSISSDDKTLIKFAPTVGDLSIGFAAE